MALSIGELVGYIDLDTSAAEGAAGRFEGILSGAGGKWGAILGAAGAGAGLAFGAAVVSAAGKEVGSDKLAASLGGGEAESERLGAIAGRVYSNGFGAGLEDVNTAMGGVITSIKGMRTASDSQVQAMTEKAMTFADVMQIDVTRAAQVAGQMVHQGLAKDGGEAFDLLMKAAQKVGPALAEDVLDATDEYGQFFTQVGIGGPEAMALLAKGAEKGMYGIDKTGDAIKEFSIRATDMSKSTRDAFATIGVDSEKMTEDLLAGGERGGAAFDKIVEGLLQIPDPGRRAERAIALFGTPLEDIGTKDIPKFLRSLQGGTDGLGDFAGAVDKAGETAYDNASTNLTMFKRTLQTGFVDLIGGSVLPKVNELTAKLNTGLGPAATAVGDAVKGTTGFLMEHKTVTAGLAGVIVGLTAVTATHAAVMAVSAAGGMTAWLLQTKLISSATKVWTAVQWAMNAALAANPIGLAVIAIAALVAAVIWVATKTEWGRNMVSKAMAGIKTAAQSVGSFFTDKLPKMFSDAWNKVKDFTTNGVDTVVTWVKGIPGKFTGALSSLGSTVGGLFRDAMNAGKEKVTGIGDTIVDWIRGIPGKLAGLAASFGTAGRNLLQQFIDGMKNAAGIIEGIAGNVWNAVKGLLNGALDKIDAALTFSINLPGPKDINFNPAIPRLATGGRATSETLAVIGEGREPESVLPDSVLRGLLERAHAAGAASGRGGNYSGPLIGQVVNHGGMDEDELAERLWFKTRTRG